MTELMTELGRIRTASSVVLLALLLALESLLPFFTYFSGKSRFEARVPNWSARRFGESCSPTI